jgi:nitrite reductase/ring-hydroxylating ferredoxin subunit
MTERNAFRVAASGHGIPEGSVVPYYLDGRRLRISVARINGHLYGFDDLCTCANEACPLSGGQLTGTTILCQCHGSRFDVTTGAVVNGPSTTALHVYPVEESDGSITLLTDGPG